MRIRHRAMLLGALLPLVAGAAETQGIDALLALDLHRLAEVRLSLGSRIEESAFTAASAVYVLERDDIVRSGHRRLADVLRLLPGVDVGKGDANKWAVAVRDGLSRFGTATLVMIDGRHIYTPLNGGVRWEAQDVAIDDIERIELVRGPGGPLWGANAVEGIIHVITRHAGQTAGTRTEGSGGSGYLRDDVALRHGVVHEGGMAWRVTARHLNSEAGDFLPTGTPGAGADPPGTRANDAGRGDALNARGDWSGGDDRLSVHGGATSYRLDRANLAGPMSEPLRHVGRYATLDWQRALNPGESLRLRLSAEHLDYDQTTVREHHTMVDLDTQHSQRLDETLLTWGLGYRHYRSNAKLPAFSVCGQCFAFDPLVDRNRTLSAFAQLQWFARDDLALTAGTKFERSDYAGVQWQPTLRASWQPHADRTIWAAWTRPVRTPTRFERGAAFFNANPALPPPQGCRRTPGSGVCRVGAGDAAPIWRVRSHELGWRERLGPATDLDLALFDNRYAFGQPANSRDRAVRAEIFGAELIVRHAFTPRARLEASYAWHDGEQTEIDGRERPTPLLAHHKLKLRWRWEPHTRWLLDANGEYRAHAPLDAPAGAQLASFTRLNVRAAYRPQRATEFWLAGTHVLGGDDAEYVDGFRVSTQPRRGWMLGFAHEF